ncbi:MAG: sulfite exporter TauE/SafE family protein [Actinomycetota bacterium]
MAVRRWAVLVTIVVTESSFAGEPGGAIPAARTNRTAVTARLVVAEARAQRAALLRTARRRSIAVSGSVIAVWSVVVLATGQLDRVVENVEAAATMVVGSFVAGSTPQGGGAVAFPVFTKALGVSAADARTFSLSIQAIGMGSAAVIIAITRRAVDRGVLRLTVPAAVTGYLAGFVVFSAVTLSGAHVKLLFTLVVVVAGVATVLSRRRAVVEQLAVAPLDTRTVRGWIVVVAALGGVASALFGSGADVAVYLAVTIVLGVRPSVGVATSVVTMAAVSVVGLLVSIATGALVVSSGGTDVLGMWLAAVPIVVVGAPLGSWFADRVSPRALATFIGSLAVVELVSTVLFVEELRTDLTVAAVGAIGLVVAGLALHRILVLRERLATGRGRSSSSVRRLDLEIGATP